MKSTRRGRSDRLAKAFLVIFLAALLSVLVGLTCLERSSAGSFPQLDPTKSWEFERFDVDIKVNTDGSLTVRETQVANFTGSFSFLNRDLTPGKAAFSEGRTYGSVRFKDIEVYDLDGKTYDDWEVEGIQGGSRVRIGFSAFNEQKGWIIEYRMRGALIYADDYDRLYYNTVSYDRSVPIKSSRTTVSLPEGADMSEVRSTEYPSESSPPGSVESGREGDTLWWEVRDIPPYSTFTVDVAFPKGLVKVPLTFRPWFGYLAISLAVLLAIGMVLGMILLWWRKGRDVSPAELDVVRYQPPEDLRPAEVGMLMTESPGTGDITATIVDLAVRGKLVITEEEPKGLLKKVHFGFKRTGAVEDDLKSFEKEVLSGLFESGSTVTQDDLKNKFYVHVSAINESVKESVLEKDFFDGDPAKVKSRYSIIALALLLLIVPIAFANRWFDPGYLYAFIPALAVSGITLFIVGRFMPRRTAKGSEALSYAHGFKEYMATAEREEMEFMTPENFQANLPYAMVLGVADKWADKFKDILTSPPDWYQGRYVGTTFSTAYLASSLSDMQTSVGGTLTSSPSSSGGGGGGFGGGSSGGGFGGGGSSAG